MPPPRMLVIAPHPDDEILGVGGSMARFAGCGGEVTVLTVAAHMPPLYPESVHETTVAEARVAHSIVGVSNSIFLDYPAVRLREVPVDELNRRIHDVIVSCEPEVVLVPFYDRHIDHRLVFEAAMVCTRPVGPGRKIQVLAAYETLSETHWNATHVEPTFAPNWFSDITDQIEVKVRAMRAYESQLHPYPEPRSIEALRALALFRGSQAGVGFAEGLHVLRMTCSPEVISMTGSR